MPRLPSDSEFSDDVLAMLTACHPLTVVRGPRGYGKTSLLARWLESSDGLPPALYVSLTTASNQVDGFWAEVAAAMVANGLVSAPDVTADGAEIAVTRVLGTRREPVLVIIDDMHEAGLHDDPEAIDDALVNLLRQNEAFYLAVAGRTLREIETVGSLTVDSAVIGPQELRLSGASVHRLASRLGVGLTMDRAQQLAVDLAGWPSAIRAGLVRSAGSDRSDAVDHELVENYIATMVRDLRFEKMRSFLLRTAVPDEFDLEMAREIVPEGNTARMLRNVLAAGLLSERRTVNGSMFSFAPAIRTAVLRVLRDSRPEVEAEVHRALVHLWEGKQRPTRVLYHAVQAREWETALEVVDQHWVQLVVEDPLALIAAARQFPETMVTGNPRVRVAVDHLDGVRPARGTNDRWRAIESPTLQAEMAAHHERLTRAGEDVLLVLLQWGLTSMLQGELDLALYAFAQARAVGMIDHGSAGVADLGTVGLALVHAVQGEPASALRWLDDPEVRERLNRSAADDAPDFVRIVAAVARALALVDAASPDATAAVHAIPEGRHRDELWALSVFVRVHHAVLTGNKDDLVTRTNELRAALRYIRRGSRTEALLTDALIEALLVAGMGQVARQVAARVEPQRLVRVALMKLAMREHSYDDVLRIATELLRSNRLTQRTAMECQVLLAGAHDALGQRGLAKEPFRSAVTIARQTGQRRPFVLMRRYTFRALADDDLEILALWPRPEERTDPEPVAHGRTHTLTARESEVLMALREHAGPVGIAEALGMSTNTVKTHLRTVYRKLGVASRAGALATLRHRA
ncbi:LuxR C-terminal-related transcriptional regulator [Ruania alba]|uniref:ATP-, maltotriose-and DNA-dependent transcriptional regulator MalT n=1 Tax=Ruania alba TaxID=648782 RepID=A0A1H5C635_9MICO|nr:LuxR C-terminal-related transcriptional regulator [Ruania alba]SED62279.1 ATP-, maltotriose-and DNA-dependent transcriptional regulator MalT [Ruania alba]